MGSLLSMWLTELSRSESSAPAGPVALFFPAEDGASCSLLWSTPWSCPPRSRWTSPAAPRPQPPSPSSSLVGSISPTWSSKPSPSQPNGQTIYVWTYDPWLFCFFLLLWAIFLKDAKSFGHKGQSNLSHPHYTYRRILDVSHCGKFPLSATGAAAVSALLFLRILSRARSGNQMPLWARGTCCLEAWKDASSAVNTRLYWKDVEPNAPWCWLKWCGVKISI